MKIGIKHDLKILLGTTVARILQSYNLEYELVGLS